MVEKVAFNAEDRLIIVNPEVTLLEVRTDLYSAAKRSWKLDAQLNKLRLPFRTIGGDDLGGELIAGAYFFLQNQEGANWRIKPDEVDHELVIVGNLYPEDVTLPMFVQTTGNYTVTIHLEKSSLTQQMGTGWTQEEKTTILSDVGMIQVKTDPLPPDPASESLVETHVTTEVDDLITREKGLDTIYNKLENHDSDLKGSTWVDESLVEIKDALGELEAALKKLKVVSGAKFTV